MALRHALALSDGPDRGNPGLRPARRSSGLSGLALPGWWLGPREALAGVQRVRAERGQGVSSLGHTLPGCRWAWPRLPCQDHSSSQMVTPQPRPVLGIDPSPSPRELPPCRFPGTLPTPCKQASGRLSLLVPFEITT